MTAKNKKPGGAQWLARRPNKFCPSPRVTRDTAPGAGPTGGRFQPPVGVTPCGDREGAAWRPCGDLPKAHTKTAFQKNGRDFRAGLVKRRAPLGLGLGGVTPTGG